MRNHSIPSGRYVLAEIRTRASSRLARRRRLSGSASTSSRLASAMPSMPSQSSRCGRSRRWSRRRCPASRSCTVPDLAGVVHPDLEHCRCCASSGIRRIENGRPMWLLKLPVVRPTDSAAVLRQCGDNVLGAVLPALPVMPTPVPAPVLPRFRARASEAREGVVNANDASGLRRDRGRRTSGCGAALSTVRNIVVAVVMFTSQRDEQVPGRAYASRCCNRTHLRFGLRDRAGGARHVLEQTASRLLSLPAIAEAAAALGRDLGRRKVNRAVGET